MTAMYGRAALEALRERQERQAVEPEKPPALLDTIPLDAPIEQPDVVLHCWSAEQQRWLPWDRWLASRPLLREDAPAERGAPKQEQRLTFGTKRKHR